MVEWEYYVQIFNTQIYKNNLQITNKECVMEKEVLKTKVDQLLQHPFHQSVFGTTPDDSLEQSIVRTGNEPVYPTVVVPVVNNPDLPDLYWVISGWNRFNTLKQLGVKEVDVIFMDITDETEIKNLIIDLNKQRIKTGRVILMEFRHYCEMYPEQRGIPGNRYSKIGKEMGRSKGHIKNMVMLDNFFHGQGEVVMEKTFSGELSVSQGFKLKEVVEKYPDKFESDELYQKLSDGSFDFKRLDYSLSNLDPNDTTEFDLMKRYLQKDLTPEQFRELLEKMGKVEQRKNNHQKNKVSVPEIDENYQSEHVHLIHGNNCDVEFTNPFGRPINCIVGSPPYGNLRLNGDDPQ